MADPTKNPCSEVPLSPPVRPGFYGQFSTTHTPQMIPVGTIMPYATKYGAVSVMKTPSGWAQVQVDDSDLTLRGTDELIAKLNGIEALFGVAESFGVAEFMGVTLDAKAKEYNALEEELIRRGAHKKYILTVEYDSDSIEP